MNVWLLLMGPDIRDRVYGPFTSVVLVGENEIRDLLTGQTIIIRSHNGWSDANASVWGDRLVFQAGGFESPWGERGIRAR